ncbi:MAG: restriction endonuclease subunit S [Patescibacteria group bacterium]
MHINQSKIEGLISELCPKGVEVFGLGSICKIETGRLNANAAVAGGDYLFFTTAKEISKIDKYRWDTEALLVAGNANVGDVKHYIGKFEAYQRTYVLTNFFKKINVRFLYFVLKNNLQEFLKSNSNSAAMTYIVLSTLENFRIPVPPLPIQEEIVKILDNFTELEVELEAELEARKNQYEHYRNKLLTFGNDIEYNNLEHIFNFKNGYTPSKAKSKYWENGDIPWFRMEDIRSNGRILDKSIQCVNRSGVKGKGVFPKDSIIVATSATIGEHALITIPHLTNQRFVSLSIKDELKQKLNIKFLFYYFFVIDEWCLKNTTKSSFSSVDMNGFRKFPIPIPPISEQERIVSTLDKFDALVNDISIGLPAELKARRQQYEYYRNKLLTFKEYVG